MVWSLPTSTMQNHSVTSSRKLFIHWRKWFDWLRIKLSIRWLVRFWNNHHRITSTEMVFITVSNNIKTIPSMNRSMDKSQSHIVPISSSVRISRVLDFFLLFLLWSGFFLFKVEQNQLIIEETSKNQSVPPPPPPPPPVPPHSQTATKPKISGKCWNLGIYFCNSIWPINLIDFYEAKPDFLTNGVSKPSPPPIAQKPILNQKNNLIDEMAKTLARRRAKIDNQSTDEISIDRSSQSVLEKSSTNQNQSSRIG